MGFLSSAYQAFRNLKDAEVDLNAREVFLVGENGQGKTNVIESLYLLCFGGSFRTRREAVLVRNGCESAVVRGRLEVSPGVSRHVSVSSGEGRPQGDSRGLKGRAGSE